MKDINIPVSVVGPGSQPSEPDGAENDFMHMPDDMATYQAPKIPEPEETQKLKPALACTKKLLQLLTGHNEDTPTQMLSLDDLDDDNRQFMDQLLGNGEVSVQCQGTLNAQIQESVLAGVWRVQYMDDKGTILHDTIEVADIPELLRTQAFSNAKENIDLNTLNIPENVYNAAPLLSEIHDHLIEQKTASEPHIINLSLLPHTENDLVFLSDTLGIGSVIILSRGYGNCRISSTKTRNVWWVQYFNSQETLILNTLEISEIPEVACAAAEDLLESAERLGEIISVYEQS